MERKFKKIRIAVLASGRGSNLAAIIEAAQSGKLDGEVVVVISNKADAGALNIARQYNIPTLHLSREQFSTEEEFDTAFLRAFEKYQVDIIALAGYMKKLSAKIVRAYKNKILNIHPALLPAFGGKGMYGLKVHQAVLDYGCKVTGVTVHIVDEEYDTGPPVLQECVPVYPEDTPESLAARVLKVEHRLYPQALQLFAEGRIEVQGRKVIVK
ncbi:MAG: phosphoribosylglycinamide formyltransferase [Calditrichaeota bacterium]|nr:MAG: phosphoribosylglycinamide formyltransferase [Calditrichota bacterium]